jgi:hypothetical protein
MTDDILRGNEDGYIAVERQGGSGTMWSDSQVGTVREQRPMIPSKARDRTVIAISHRIADAIVRRMKQ